MGSNKEIFNNPSIPIPEVCSLVPRFRNRLLRHSMPLPGVVPSPLNCRKGCVFYNRFCEAKKRCQDAQTDLDHDSGTDKPYDCRLSSGWDKRMTEMTEQRRYLEVKNLKKYFPIYGGFLYQHQECQAWRMFPSLSRSGETIGNPLAEERLRKI